MPSVCPTPFNISNAYPLPAPSSHWGFHVADAARRGVTMCSALPPTSSLACTLYWCHVPLPPQVNLHIGTIGNSFQRQRQRHRQREERERERERYRDGDRDRDRDRQREERERERESERERERKRERERGPSPAHTQTQIGRRPAVRRKPHK